MKELGVGFATRMAAKGLKPRLVISDNGGKWTVRSESSLKTTSYDFTPGAEFNETTPDGREVKVRSIILIFLIEYYLLFILILKSTINFEGNKWVHTSIDKSGKKSVVTRYVDDNGQHMIVRYFLSLFLLYFNFMHFLIIGNGMRFSKSSSLV